VRDAADFSAVELGAGLYQISILSPQIKTNFWWVET